MITRRYKLIFQWWIQIGPLIALTLCLCLLLISQKASAQSSVWKVEKNGRQIYLGGTIHLLTKADYPLPGEFDLAYNKPQRQFETFQQHLSFLSKTAGGSGDQLILNGLKDMQNLSTMVPELKRIWRSGDREKFQTFLLNPYMKYYPKAYQVLIVQRNNNWMPRIEALFKTPEVELVLVGALHMIGENGLLQRLEAMGYEVAPL